MEEELHGCKVTMPNPDQELIGSLEENTQCLTIVTIFSL